MVYAQKNYNELIGRHNPVNDKNPVYRINQTGCLLTSFSNILTVKFGRDTDPLTLNAAFRDRGIYIDIDDGVLDDLGWQSITGFDGSIVVDKTGTSGIPANDKAIVRIKAGNRFGTHFCAVDHIDGSQVYIIDSWDGQIKNSSFYGPITGWATYRDIRPQPIQPIAPLVKPAPQLQGANYDGNDITIQPGWGISHALKAANFPDFGSEQEWNRVANLNGVSRWQDFHLSTGQRIHIGKYTSPLPTPLVADTNTSVDIIPVKVVPSDPNAWKETHMPYNAQVIFNQDTVIIDLENIHPKVIMQKGNRVSVDQKFVKDGITYLRPVKSTLKDAWFGIPDDPSIVQINEPDEDIAELSDPSFIKEAKEAYHTMTSGERARKKTVAIVARLTGIIQRMLLIIKLGKQNKGA